MAPSHLAVASASHVYGSFGKSIGDVCVWELCGYVVTEESELIYFAFRLFKTVKPNSPREMHVTIFILDFSEGVQKVLQDQSCGTEDMGSSGSILDSRH